LADVFISYKSERRNAARHLTRILELNGFSVWFDYGLLSGTNFGPQIEREIRAAKAVVVLWCSLSRESRWVLEEAHLATRLGTLTPTFLERVDPPLGFALADTIDLTIWDGAPRSHHLDRLLSEIGRRVGRDPVSQFQGLRAYEETWRSFGAPPLSRFALTAPVAEREEERFGKQEKDHEQRDREARERQVGELEIARKAQEEREQRAAEEAARQRRHDEQRRTAEVEQRAGEADARQRTEAVALSKREANAARSAEEELGKKAESDATAGAAPRIPENSGHYFVGGFLLITAALVFTICMQFALDNRFSADTLIYLLCDVVMLAVGLGTIRRRNWARFAGVGACVIGTAALGAFLVVAVYSDLHAKSNSDSLILGIATILLLVVIVCCGGAAIFYVWGWRSNSWLATRAPKSTSTFAAFVLIVDAVAMLLLVIRAPFYYNAPLYTIVGPVILIVIESVLSFYCFVQFRKEFGAVPSKEKPS
jgi:TIR domain-containing protein